MAQVSDFQVIVGNEDERLSSRRPLLEENFQSGGRTSSQTAYLSLMVKGLTRTRQNAEVRINNQFVGVIFHNFNGNPEQWQTQLISFPESRLGGSSNELEIRDVNSDDFFVRNVICYFHQNA